MSPPGTPCSSVSLVWVCRTGPKLTGPESVSSCVWVSFSKTSIRIDGPLTPPEPDAVPVAPRIRR